MIRQQEKHIWKAFFGKKAFYSDKRLMASLDGDFICQKVCWSVCILILNGSLHPYLHSRYGRINDDNKFMNNIIIEAWWYEDTKIIFNNLL